MRTDVLPVPEAPAPSNGTPRPSPHQEAILDAVRNTSDNLIIQACAGSGKTTTLRMICEAMPISMRVVAVCFNRSIAQEFERKLPRHIEVGTMHKIGFKIVRQNRPKARLDEYKINRVLKDFSKRLRFRDNKEASAWCALMQRTAGLVMATMTNAEDHAELMSLAGYYDLELEPADLADVAMVVRKLRMEQDTISFDDMIDAPLFHGYTFPKYDVVLIDEAQDLNASQLEFCARLAASGRIIAVGDRNQSIYGFRGADHAAMDRLQERFQCRELPLSVCYRCGKSIVAEAQRVVGAEAIQAPDIADDGLVIRREPKEMPETLSTLQPGDMVICRTNKPLVAPCFELIRRGIKAVIRGRDIGKGLLALVDKHAGKIGDMPLDEMIAAVNRWKWQRINILLAQEKEAQAQTIEDQVDTLAAIAENVGTVQELRKAIETIFSDDVVGVLFSSVHRAKGLEADCVVLLAPEQIPHPMAKTPEALQQERNLEYVAKTRPRFCLVYQPLPKEKK